MSRIDTEQFFTKQLTVNSFHADLKGELSIPSLFYFFQEIAWEHATIHGFGYEDLKSQNQFWVLSRIHLVADKLPRWSEQFSLSTWPCGIDGPFALRDFVITNHKGEQVARATSSWLIVDAQTRRPKRPDGFRERMPVCESIRATATNAPRIDNVQGEMLCETNRTVGVCDIDVNGHINNTRYIEWAVDSIALDDYRRKAITQVDVNFLAEGFCHDICMHKTEDLSVNFRKTTITRISDGKDLAIVRIALH
jgi:acyl-ACP thioesterase